MNEKSPLVVCLMTLSLLVLASCKHPLEPVGNGDIISFSGTRTCLLEDYQAFAQNCDSNELDGAYYETYTAVPRPGWKFVRWENYCENVVGNQCIFDVSADIIEQFSEVTANPLRAIFAPEPFELVLGEPPTQLMNVDADFAPDVPYGPHPEHRLDIFLPPSSTRTPLVIFIHGGGFTSGFKEKAYTSAKHREVAEVALANGIAFATLDYRLLQTTLDPDGVIKPLSDSARALQYLRLHAETFNIDPDNIALYGSSAGAGTSLWLGTSDDMANTRSAEPYQRMSTRVRAVGLYETQSTYNMLRWEEVFSEFSLTIAQILQASPQLAARLLNFYGIHTLQELFTPEIVHYRENVDMLAQLQPNEGDAPIWLRSENQLASIPLSTGALLHHPLHALAVKERADIAGVENVAYIPKLGIQDSSGETLPEFLLRKLEVTMQNQDM